MKTWTIFFTLILVTFHISAQQLITVQHNGVSAFYTTINLAYANSQAGDTIYIPGGAFNGTITSDKEIHIIGVGHDPDFTAATDKSVLQGTLIFDTGSGNSTVTGITVNSISINPYQDLPGVNSLEISRCNVGGVSIYNPSTNNTIMQCVISDIYGDNTQNNAFYNNIITYQISYLGINNVVKNNIFLANNCCSPGESHLYSVLQSIIENNIFYGNSNSRSITDQSLFKNNIFVTNWICSSSEICANNLTNISQDLIFITPFSGQFDYSDDFHLISGSPGKNAGTDGTDIGIYGGDFPWKEGSVPFNPHIISKTISTKTNSSGNINVNITVEAQEE